MLFRSQLEISKGEKTKSLEPVKEKLDDLFEQKHKGNGAYFWSNNKAFYAQPLLQIAAILLLVFLAFNYLDFNQESKLAKNEVSTLQIGDTISIPVVKKEAKIEPSIPEKEIPEPIAEKEKEEIEIILSDEKIELKDKEVMKPEIVEMNIVPAENDSRELNQIVTFSSDVQNVSAYSASPAMNINTDSQISLMHSTQTEEWSVNNRDSRKEDVNKKLNIGTEKTELSMETNEQKENKTLEFAILTPLF